MIYAAKSTEDFHGSIPDQIEACRAAIEREGGFVYGEPQSDENASAYSGNRGLGLSEAKRLAAEAASIYGAAHLWVQHSDRLARGDGLTADHLAEVFFATRRQGVRLRSVQDDSNFEDVIRVALVGERNNEDSRRKSQAVRDGMRRRVADRKKPNGGPPPYGYRWVLDPDAQHDPRRKPPSKLVPAPHEAEVVRRIFREFVGGMSQKEITRRLIRDGIPAQRRTWHQGTVSNALRQPAYIGRNRFHGEALEAEHEPIIDEATWQRAQQLREASARTKGGGRGRPSAGSHLFTKGLLRCGECGSAMVPRTIGTRGYEVYLCYGRVRDKDSCSQGPVRRSLVDMGVEQHLLSVGVDVEATAAELAAQMDAELDRVDAQLVQAQREEARAQERYARVRRAFQDGTIEAEDWNEQRPELLSEREAAAASVERLTKQRNEVAARAARRDAEAETLRWMAAIREAIVGELRDAASVEALRSCLLRLFDHFTLHRVDSDSLPEHPGLYADLVLPGGYIIEPHVRPDVVESFDGPVPVLRREPLSLIDKDGMGRPFSYEELLARIRAVLRRAAPRRGDVLPAGEIEIDRPTRCVRVCGHRVLLPAKEYELLVKLAEQPTRVFTKEELLRSTLPKST